MLRRIMCLLPVVALLVAGAQADAWAFGHRHKKSACCSILHQLVVVKRRLRRAAIAVALAAVARAIVDAVVPHCPADGGCGCGTTTVTKTIWCRPGKPRLAQ